MQTLTTNITNLDCIHTTSPILETMVKYYFLYYLEYHWSYLLYQYLIQRFNSGEAPKEHQYSLHSTPLLSTACFRSLWLVVWHHRNLPSRARAIGYSTAHEYKSWETVGQCSLPDSPCLCCAKK